MLYIYTCIHDIDNSLISIQSTRADDSSLRGLESRIIEEEKSALEEKEDSDRWKRHTTTMPGVLVPIRRQCPPAPPLLSYRHQITTQLIALTLPPPQPPPPPLGHTLSLLLLILTLLILTLPVSLPLPPPPNPTREEIYVRRKRNSNSSISDTTLQTASGSILLPPGSRVILILFLATTTNAP